MRVDLGSDADVQEGRTKCVTVDGKAFALFRISGKVYCLDNHCTHVGGPLCRGALKDNVVTCPLHGSRFDARSGQVIGGPAQRPVASYPVHADGGKLSVDVP